MYVYIYIYIGTVLEMYVFMYIGAVLEYIYVCIHIYRDRARKVYTRI